MEDFRCRRTRIRARRPALARAPERVRAGDAGSRVGVGGVQRVRAAGGGAAQRVRRAARPISDCGHRVAAQRVRPAARPLNESSQPHGHQRIRPAARPINESDQPHGHQRIQPAARPIGGGRSAAPPRTTKPGTVGPCRACARSLRQFMFTHKPVLASIFTTPSVKLLPESAPAGAPPGALSTPSTCFHCPSPWCSSACVLPSGPTTTT